PVAGRGRDRRDASPGGGRHRGREGPGRRRPQDRGRAARHRRGRGDRREEPRPRDPGPAGRELHQPRGRGRLMADERTPAYAEALLAVAAAEGQLGEVEDELFRFAQTLEGSDELRDALTDPHIPASRRQQIVEDLLGEKATSTTTALVSLVVGTGRGKDLPAIIHELVEMSARQVNKEVA